MANITNIPAPRVPFTDAKTGLVSREWYRFLLNLFRLTGSGTNDITIVDQAVQPLSAEPDLRNLFDMQIAPPVQAPDYDAAIMSAVLAANTELSSRLTDIANTIQDINLRPPYTPQVRQASWGTFSDSTSQTAAATNTAYAVTFNTTDLDGGVTRGATTSQIIIPRTGVYNFQFSAQLNKTSASAKKLWIWAAVDGVAIPNSATEMTLAGSNAAIVAAWNWVLLVPAGSYFSIMWSTNDTACYIQSIVATAPVPGIPSILLTVTDNIRPYQD